jgi:hypothetical protein
MQTSLMMVAFLMLVTAAEAQQGAIDPTWVYTTPIHWQRLVGAPSLMD